MNTPTTSNVIITNCYNSSATVIITNIQTFYNIASFSGQTIQVPATNPGNIIIYNASGTLIHYSIIPSPCATSLTPNNIYYTITGDGHVEQTYHPNINGCTCPLPNPPTPTPPIPSSGGGGAMQNWNLGQSQGPWPSAGAFTNNVPNPNLTNASLTSGSTYLCTSNGNSISCSPVKGIESPYR